MNFDALVAEPIEFGGWDFSSFVGRISEAPTPWNYTALAAVAAKHSHYMVDMGTGGGELLLALVQGLGNKVPHSIYATEAWEANIPVARKCLEPPGITVVPFTEDSRLPLGGRANLILPSTSMNLSTQSNLDEFFSHEQHF